LAVLKWFWLLPASGCSSLVRSHRHARTISRISIGFLPIEGLFARLLRPIQRYLLEVTEAASASGMPLTKSRYHSAMSMRFTPVPMLIAQRGGRLERLVVIDPEHSTH
jgi:hypothetical protein